MAKTCRCYLPEQSLLLPPDLRDWLPDDHLAYFVSELVDELDLGAIESYYEAETRGQPPYHPRRMVKLLVYGYSVGVRSSRKIARRVDEDIALRVLAADNRPDFRKIHLKALEALFGQVLRLAVEPSCPLIVGQTLTNEANDQRQLEPLVEAVERQAGQRPAEVLAGSGYCADTNLEYLASENEPEKGIEAWLATQKTKHDEPPPAVPRGRIAQALTRVERMRRKLRTKAGKKVYARRKAIVEPVFGQIKQARGMRQFLLRGLEKAKGEWALICLTHNVLKMHRLVTA